MAFWKKIEPRIGKLKNVAIENNNESMVLSYETTKESKITQRVINLWLADSIVSYYKEQYLLKKLILPEVSNLSFEIIVKALTVFDKASDVGIVLDKIKKTSEINIYSFYVFKMSDLRTKWQDVCDLFQVNLPVLANKGVMMELMRYLLIVTETSVSVVNLYQEDNFWILRGGKGQVLADPIPLKGNKSSIRVILELISLAPEQINIKFNEKLTPDLSLFLENLFPSKVVYCT